jgi:HNH endonuclease
MKVRQRPGGRLIPCLQAASDQGVTKWCAVPGPSRHASLSPRQRPHFFSSLIFFYSPRPVLYPQHGRARWVFDLYPALASPGTVGQIAPLRHDAFEPELACVLGNDRAVAVEMLREPHPIVAREQLFELAFALFERRRPQVLATVLTARTASNGVMTTFSDDFSMSIRPSSSRTTSDYSPMTNEWPFFGGIRGFARFDSNATVLNVPGTVGKRTYKHPWSQGGKTTVENGQVACLACNASKGGILQPAA